MIVVHHLENSRSQRIVWLLEELAVDYEIRTYPRDPKTQLAPASLKQVHPLGKSPVVTDDDHTVAESGAIIEYLIARHDGQWLVPPVGTPQWVHYLHWLHYAEGSAMPPLLMRLVMSRLGKKPVPAILRPAGKMLEQGVRQQYLDPQLQAHFDYWESELGQHAWFAGDQFTAADIQMSFVLLACERGGEFAKRPNVRRFLEQIREREAYQRTVAKIGEFAL
ncbi:glutathione S-transferase [Salinicola halophilus]|uniref:glutathione S-transferase n=1 Tax=Salinicola halophilus TaxID=184065 RepID=UPI000DA11BB2|nr:glutathione S-transferase [Salinicola halophilus]